MSFMNYMISNIIQHYSLRKVDSLFIAFMFSNYKGSHFFIIKKEKKSLSQKRILS